MLGKFFQHLRAWRAERRHVPVRSLRWDAEGLDRLRDGESVWSIRWSEVKQIFAYKDDVFAYDIICIGFRLDDEGTWCWVDEEMLGYAGLLEELQRRFGPWPEDWWHAVAFPAFERCFTHLWGQPFDWDQ